MEVFGILYIYYGIVLLTVDAMVYNSVSIILSTYFILLLLICTEDYMVWNSVKLRRKTADLPSQKYISIIGHFYFNFYFQFVCFLLNSKVQIEYKYWRYINHMTCMWPLALSHKWKLPNIPNDALRHVIS